MSEKLTHTWVLRYSLSSTHNTPKPISTLTTIISTGQQKWLKMSGEIETRPMLENEKSMPVFLFEQVFLDEVKNGKKVRNAYMQRTFEVAKPGVDKTQFAPEKWMELQRNKGCVEFFQQHIAVTCPDATGEQLNKNYSATDKAYFKLINLDLIDEQTADADLLGAQLLGEVGHIMKTDRAEFENICYGMQINPFNMGDGDLFKLLKRLIFADLKGFDKFLHGDGESRWFKIVLNKALRFKQNDGSTILEKDEHANFTSNGIVVANGFEALVAYYKAHPEMFDHLEITLGMKKKESIDQTEEAKDPEQKRSPGRPKAAAH